MKKWLRRNLPSSKSIRENRSFSVFCTLLLDPNLWHLNRRSAAGAFGVGLFVMYMPPVAQMLMAAAAAIVFRVNLPISVALVWISNPLTTPPCSTSPTWWGAPSSGPRRWSSARSVGPSGATGPLCSPPWPSKC